MKTVLLAAGAVAFSLIQAGAVHAESSAALDEVIITAERAHRALRETSSSVEVATGDDIERASGVYSVNDLLERIPNVVATEPGNDMPAVRGLDGTGPGGGSTAFFAGSRPRFSYMVDGRTLSFNEATFGDTSLWDLEQVEVYRGPQSTLLGRNAIAGVVAITTANPTFEWRGAARAIVGNLDERQLSGAIGGPIVSDLLAFRASADWQRSESFVDFVGYPGTDDPGRYDIQTYRGKLLLTPSSAIQSLLTVSYQDGREPQSNWVKRPFEDGVSIDSGLAQPVFRSRTTTAISDTTFKLTDALNLQVRLSGDDFRINRYAPAFTGIAQIDGREYVVEPLLRYGSSNDQLSGFIGAYVLRTRQDETNDLLGGGVYRDETDTTSIFGEATVKPIDRVSLIVGARYEEEARYRVGATGPLATNFQETYKEFLPKATLAFDVASEMTIGATVARGYNAGGAGITLAPPYLGYTYAPEYVWSYEGFVRAGLSPSLSLTGNVFYSRYTDMQLPYYLTATSIEIRNAERATTYGAEAGLTWRPSAANEIFARVGLLKTNVDRYDDPSSEGNELPRAPAFNVAAGFTVSPGGRFEFGADVRYSSAYYSDVLNEARGRVDPYVTVNAQVAYNAGPARYFLSARNVFDNRDPVQIIAGSDAASDYAVIPEPRKVSAGIELRF